MIATGCILAIKGPQWWHVSNVGHFVNSCHLWSVELFFFAMVVHLWGKFFMAAWRGRRAMTWILGVVTFVASIVTAFTGYLSQTNFDAQWIGTQAKDGINATGGGGIFNVLDFGQMLMWHIALMPAVVVVLTALHVVMVRRRGVVPPFPAKGEARRRRGRRMSRPRTFKRRPRRARVHRALPPLRHREGGRPRPRRRSGS